MRGKEQKDFDKIRNVHSRLSPTVTLYNVCIRSPPAQSSSHSLSNPLSNTFSFSLKPN